MFLRMIFHYLGHQLYQQGSSITWARLETSVDSRPITAYTELWCPKTSWYAESTASSGWKSSFVDFVLIVYHTRSFSLGGKKTGGKRQG